MTRDDRHLRFWFAGTILCCALLWLLSAMLLPFVAGLAIAYLLDPLVHRLQSHGVPRWLSAGIVLLSFFVLLTLVVILLVPVVQTQVVGLIDTLPHLVDWVRETVVPAANRILTRFSAEDVDRLRTGISQFAGDVVGWVVRVLRGLVTSGIAFFDVLSIIFITPVVAFYLLRDWEDMIGTIDRVLPRRYLDVIRAEAHEVDRTLAGFVRGQATVCASLGLYYGVALSAVGLNFGVTIGLLIGLLAFIPYVGSATGFAVSVAVALGQFSSYLDVGIVVTIFVIGQLIEGNVLTPKLVGDRVGLHPVWVIFALLAGGNLFGFAGVLLAVPMAAVLGVLIRFAVRQYKHSRYYQDPEPAAAGAAPFDDETARP
ncbi:MAG: AI-2E family transporter [Azospirillaceae bacterium]|nr:AI-2E family transporter [Azospirillaceae bacterium]